MKAINETDIKRRYYENGSIKSEQYYENDRWHRDSNIGPAYIEYYENGSIYYESYYENGKRHRDSNIGPANITYDEDGKVIDYEFYEDNIKLHKKLDEAELERLGYVNNFKLKFSD